MVRAASPPRDGLPHTDRADRRASTRGSPSRSARRRSRSPHRSRRGRATVPPSPRTSSSPWRTPPRSQPTAPAPAVRPTCSTPPFPFTCPQTSWADQPSSPDDGKIFISASGTYMQTRCNAHVGGGVAFASDARSTLTECFNYCSDTPGCKRQDDPFPSVLPPLADRAPSSVCPGKVDVRRGCAVSTPTARTRQWIASTVGRPPLIGLWFCIHLTGWQRTTTWPS